MLSPKWQILNTDARGKTTERVWCLPRIGKWPDMAVFDKMHGKDRLSVHYRIAGSKNAFSPSGITFSSQRALFEWMLANPCR